MLISHWLKNELDYQPLIHLNISNLYSSRMIFAYSNEVIPWSPDFGPDSVFLIIQDLVQEIKTRSKKTSASLELNVVPKTRIFGQTFGQVPVTPIQRGTFEKREDVFVSAGAKNMDSSGYELSDFEDNELWENAQLELVLYLDQG